ncbi:O-antigen ligase family protein [Pigmentiphaga aceris]|uniref:O-antigen ligase family protein n=1 Tax=Pigmentiphaga aceris TaxID=1940612 RepID=A0A5C0B3T1_9BURK|nr:O-antigen ligase family protein [Pigmentiphaga aceris]QEI07451.1 O-antigen ligase family protein [Pigmentiphaga aceris]
MQVRLPTRRSVDALTGWSAAIAVCLLPALTLTIRGSANRILLVLLLCAAIAAVVSHRTPDARFGALARRYWALYAAMTSLLVAAAVSTLAWGERDMSVLDTPTRVAVFGLVFFAVMGAPRKLLKQFQWGCVIGAIAAALMLAVALQANGGERPLQVGFTNLLAFSNIALLLGLFSFLSISWSNWQSNAGKLCVLVKIGAGTAGLLASYASGSRGGWLALPVMALVLLVQYRGSWRIKVLALLLVVTAVLSAYHFNPKVQMRTAAAHTEITEYLDGKNLDSSVGTRLQLWNAAWLTFTQHPLIGVSRQNYKQTMSELAQRGVLTPTAAAFGHSHNELMFNLATLGLLGVASMLSIWLVPAVVFASAARSMNPDKRIAGTMGLFLTLGFMVFGLTEVMFTVSMVAAFYTVVAATLLAIIVKADEDGRGKWDNAAA